MTSQLSIEQLQKENEELRALLSANGISIPAAASQEHHPQACPRSSLSYEHSNHNLPAEIIQRYSRQIILPSFGVHAQAALQNSAVLIVGAGGLGCPVAQYLAASGIGRLGILDRDTVDRSNLHRQILHRDQDVGRHKAHSAAAACRRLNPNIVIDTHTEGLSRQNAVSLVSQYDVVVDASDNPPTRYLVSDACVVCHKPLVFGAAIGTDGQLTVYNYGEAACSRCADAGVLGPVPGVIGVLQAVETIKILTKMGTVLSQRMLLYDALAPRMHVIKLRGKRADCIACGENPSISSETLTMFDYTGFTGGHGDHDKPEALTVLTEEHRWLCEQVHDALVGGGGYGGGVLLLDTRPATQFAIARLPGSVNIPYDNPSQCIDEALRLCTQHKQQQCVVVCRRGNDSQLVVRELLRKGVVGVKDMVGGLEAWATQVDPSFPAY